MSELKFFITAMPDTRPADYYLGCLEGSVFMDFENCEHECIRLKRISFDGYGCCDLGDQAIPMNEVDSRVFKEIIEARLSDEARLTTIVKKTISSNKKLIWVDALNEYGLS
jgi:hypothetical protein